MTDQRDNETREKRTSSRPPPSDSAPPTDRSPPDWESPNVIVQEDDGEY